MSQSELDLDTVKVILGEYRISNADVTLRHDATAEELIDVIEGNRIYIPCIYVLNKIDQISIEVSYSSLLYRMYYYYILDFAEAEIMGWQWHQLNHMQAICHSVQKITMPAPHQSDFYGPDALPDTQPTASKH